MTHGIELKALQVLLQAQAIREARANRQNDLWTLSVRLGAFWHPIRTRRDPIRTWSNLSALGKFCDTAGIKTLCVEF